MCTAAVLSAASLGAAARGWVNDDSLAGWLITVAYFVAAFACALVWREDFHARSRLHPIRDGWLLAAAVLLLLGANKQLDLHTWLIATMRDVAGTQGWYAQRRGVQLVFAVVALGVIASVVVHCSRQTEWSRPRAHHILVELGAACLGAYLVHRIGTICHVSWLTGPTWIADWGDHLLEVIGVHAIALGAVAVLLRHRIPTPLPQRTLAAVK